MHRIRILLIGVGQYFFQFVEGWMLQCSCLVVMAVDKEIKTKLHLISNYVNEMTVGCLVDEGT